MGVRCRGSPSGSWRAAARPTQAAAVMERGTLPGQRTVSRRSPTSLGRAAGIRAPAITLVGDVAGLRERLAWLESRPLFGRTVAVTRARAQASRAGRAAAGCSAPRWSRRRRSAPGARSVSLPELVLRPHLRDVAERRRLLLDRLRDARELAGGTVATIGPGTARALRARGIEPDSCPSGRSPKAWSRRSPTSRSTRADRPCGRGP